MSFPHRAPLRAGLLGVAALVSGSVAAGPSQADPAPPFLELLAQSQATSPRLAESDSDVHRAAGLAQQAGVRPNPTIEFVGENFAGSRPYSGIDQTEFTLSAAQALELGGKRPARIAAGAASISAARFTRDQARSEYAFSLATAYLQADVAGRKLQLAKAALALAREDARVASVLVTAGREAELRALQADTVVNTVRSEVTFAESEREAALSSLTALAGAPTPFTSLSQSLLAHADQVEAAVAPDPLSTPAYLAAKGLREAAARRIRVEQTRATPDLTVSLGVRRLQGDHATALVGGVSIPFPVFDRNRGNISAAQAELQGADARLNAARLDAEASIRSSTVKFTASQVRLGAAKDAERTGQEAYRLTRIGYEAGKLPLIELLNARRSLAEAATQTLTARVERLNAEAELARLQGRIPFGDRP